MDRMILVGCLLILARVEAEAQDGDAYSGPETEPQDTAPVLGRKMCGNCIFVNLPPNLQVNG